MSVSGKELGRLLESDGWQRGGYRTHGVFYSKRFPGESLPRSTIVPDRTRTLPAVTLGAILSMKQTGLGSAGLESLRSPKPSSTDTDSPPRPAPGGTDSLAEEIARYKESQRLAHEAERLDRSSRKAMVGEGVRRPVSVPASSPNRGRGGQEMRSTRRR